MTQIHTGHANGDSQLLPQTVCDLRMHNLDHIAGYYVGQTYARGEKLGKRPVVQHFEGAGKYADAVATARGIKVTRADKIVAWAVVSAIYADGCESEPFWDVKHAGKDAGQKGKEKRTMKNLNDAVRRMIDAGKLSERVLEMKMVPVALTVAQLRLLMLADDDDQITPSMMARHIFQESHSVSGLLNRLEDRALITRVHDREDRRVVHVGLTGEGRSVLGQALHLIAPSESILARIGPDVDQLSQLVEHKKHSQPARE